MPGRLGDTSLYSLTYRACEKEKQSRGGLVGRLAHFQ